MIHQQPPFGMTQEITQVRTKEITSGYRIGYTQTEDYPPPQLDKPACYVKKGSKACGSCQWNPDCANAEKK